MEKFVEYLEEEVKRLYSIFAQQPMMELTDVLKREHKQKTITFASKNLMTHRTEK